MRPRAAAMIVVNNCGLTATHRDHDFETIAVLQYTGIKPAAWHDFAVTLHGDALARQLHCVDQFGATRCVVEGARFAVDND
jgi:hypothetical protein